MNVILVRRTEELEESFKRERTSWGYTYASFFSSEEELSLLWYLNSSQDDWEMQERAWNWSVEGFLKSSLWIGCCRISPPVILLTHFLQGPLFSSTFWNLWLNAYRISLPLIAVPSSSPRGSIQRSRSPFSSPPRLLEKIWTWIYRSWGQFLSDEELPLRLLRWIIEKLEMKIGGLRIGIAWGRSGESLDLKLWEVFTLVDAWNWIKDDWEKFRSGIEWKEGRWCWLWQLLGCKLLDHPAANRNHLFLPFPNIFSSSLSKNEQEEQATYSTQSSHDSWRCRHSSSQANCQLDSDGTERPVRRERGGKKVSRLRGSNWELSHLFTWR